MLLETQVRLAGEAIWIRTQCPKKPVYFLLDFVLAAEVCIKICGMMLFDSHLLLPTTRVSLARHRTPGSLPRANAQLFLQTLQQEGEVEVIAHPRRCKWHFGAIDRRMAKKDKDRVFGPVLLMQSRLCF
jgi:hypothetical protein